MKIKNLRTIVFGTLLILALTPLAYAVCFVSRIAALKSKNPATTNYIDGKSALTEWASLDALSPYLICAIIKVEDRNFFDHRGFDWGQIGRAISGAWSGTRSMGGSTITQQLARNLFLSSDRTLTRKLSEAVLTVLLETFLTKARILEIYLNVIEWGSGIWGIVPAARIYFGTTPQELDIRESLHLGSLLSAPKAKWEGKHLEQMQRTRKRVVFQLYYSGILSEHAVNTLAQTSGRSPASITPFRWMDKWRREIPEAIPIDRFVTEKCGVEREKTETEIHRQPRRGIKP